MLGHTPNERAKRRGQNRRRPTLSRQASSTARARAFGARGKAKRKAR